MMDTATMGTVLITLVIFVMFMLLGYLSKKRSGGFFLLLAGFSLISIATLSFGILGFMSIILVIFGCFVILSGVLKAFYNSDNSQAESSQS